MASAYSLGSCRSSTRYPRNPNEFRVRRATRFSNGVYQSSLSGDPSIPVLKRASVQSCNAAQFADLLYRAFRHRFRRGAVQEDLSRGIFIQLNPPSNTIRVVRRDAIICVHNGCPEEAVLEALAERCGQCWDPKEIEYISNWWLTGNGCTTPAMVAAAEEEERIAEEAEEEKKTFELCDNCS